jgi:geranylgeranyl diphosphate synthase type II
MSSDISVVERLEIRPRTRQHITRLQARARAEVMASLPTGEPRDYLYDLLPSYPERSGKGLRPLLCLAACEAYGGSSDAAMPFAVAIELMHNAFLVHDDIQDGSTHRRGRPALHVEHGVPLALNTGDALAAAANSVLVRAARSLPADVAVVVFDRWERTMRETLEGQALDLGWQRDNVHDLALDDYFAMAGKKTAWYTTILPLAIGALVGARRARSVDESFGFGWLLGLLFQISNDIAGVDQCDGPGDIEEGKRTILIIHLLGVLRGDDRAELVRIMGSLRRQRGPDEVAWVAARMAEHGSIEYARACLYGLAGAALRQAEIAFDSVPRSPARDILFSITPHVMEHEGLLGVPILS